VTWSDDLDLPLSSKQIDFFLDSTARINISEGSVRSGKTVVSLFRWLEYLVDPPSGELIVIGKTRDTAYRNLFRPLMDRSLFGSISSQVDYRQGAPTGRILGRTVHVIGANDAVAETKIRGMTVAGCLADEVTLLPESFFRQTLARMSPPGAKLFGTTNPDNRRHWLKRCFLDRESDLDLRSWHFTLDDNKALPPSYVANLKAEYTGLWYKRFVSGLWVNAEGAIYDSFDEDRIVEDEIPRITSWVGIGIDYGTTNPFVALLAGIGKDGRLHVISEWRHDSRTAHRQLTDPEYAEAIRGWLSSLSVPGLHEGLGLEIVVDPSAASFTQQLWRDGWSPTKGRNAVQDGIRAVAGLIAKDALRIHRSCKGLLDELAGYVWDDKALLLGVEQPLKVDDHGPDALRYLTATTIWSWRDQIPALTAA